jgi:hypothetical protein
LGLSYQYDSIGILGGYGIPGGLIGDAGGRHAFAPLEIRNGTDGILSVYAVGYDADAVATAFRNEAEHGL